jgi:CRISPR/Cas system CSM-associated protein Csm2 small subunit
MQSQLLKDILQTAKIHKNQCLAVFDLDSTLFDVTPRILQVINSFAVDPQHEKDFPESVKILKEMQLLKSDWGLKNAVVRAGLGDHAAEFHEALKKHWRKYFFSNEFLHYDIPYDGAVEFVQALHKLNVRIAYLTGRDVERMGTGSAEVLQKWKFPLNDSDAHLVLKPKKGLDDAQFKSDWFAKINTDDLQKIWFFENEPANIHLVRQCHQQVQIVFFESTHSGKADPPTDLPKIIHYLLETGKETV